MTATCGHPVIESITGRRARRLVRMRRCGAPAAVPATMVNDEHGPIALVALCAEHAGAGGDRQQPPRRLGRGMGLALGTTMGLALLSPVPVVDDDPGNFNASAMLDTSQVVLAP